MTYVVGPRTSAQAYLCRAGARAVQEVGRKFKSCLCVHGSGKFVRLIIAPVTQVVWILRNSHQGVGPGQAAGGLLQKSSEQRGQVEVTVKFEPQKHMAQCRFVKPMKGRARPRGRACQAMAAEAAFLGIRQGVSVR